MPSSTKYVIVSNFLIIDALLINLYKIYIWPLHNKDAHNHSKFFISKLIKVNGSIQVII
jgi:hypothetical protein